jgi:hypothetical protein
MEITKIPRNSSKAEGFTLDESTGMTYHTVTLDVSESLLLDVTPEDQNGVTITVSINRQAVKIIVIKIPLLRLVL